MTRARMRLRWGEWSGGQALLFGGAVVGGVCLDALMHPADADMLGNVRTSDGVWGNTCVYRGSSRAAAKRAVRAFVVREMRAAVKS